MVVWQVQPVVAFEPHALPVATSVHVPAFAQHGIAASHA
jgi:hypothetical protein